MAAAVRRDEGGDGGAAVIAVTAAEMRALDRWTIEHGTPGHVLMERAGAARPQCCASGSAARGAGRDRVRARATTAATAS
jgi:hypothetical protein